MPQRSGWIGYNIESRRDYRGFFQQSKKASNPYSAIIQNSRSSTVHVSLLGLLLTIFSSFQAEERPWSGSPCKAFYHMLFETTH
jgi:hypothetical protein